MFYFNRNRFMTILPGMQTESLLEYIALDKKRILRNIENVSDNKTFWKTGKRYSSDKGLNSNTIKENSY